MKKTHFQRIFIAFLLLLQTAGAFAAEPIPKYDKEALTAMSTTEKEATLLNIKTRLLEIKQMDKSSLSKVEKKALKNEIKNAKAVAKGLSSRVTISLGAIIIIILLIIIIF